MKLILNEILCWKCCSRNRNCSKWSKWSKTKTIRNVGFCQTKYGSHWIMTWQMKQLNCRSALTFLGIARAFIGGWVILLSITVYFFFFVWCNNSNEAFVLDSKQKWWRQFFLFFLSFMSSDWRAKWCGLFTIYFREFSQPISLRLREVTFRVLSSSNSTL